MSATKKPDYVTRARWRRGEIFIEKHADPARPQLDQAGVQVGFHQIRGARAAQGGHDYLLRRGSLDAVQHAAADRFLRAWEGHARLSSALANVDGVQVPPHQRGHPSMARVSHAETLRQAQAALGSGQLSLVYNVVVRGLTLGTVGGAAGETDLDTRGRLRGALDRLAEVWGIESA